MPATGAFRHAGEAVLPALEAGGTGIGGRWQAVGSHGRILAGCRRWRESPGSDADRLEQGLTLLVDWPKLMESNGRMNFCTEIRG
ncbi:hypothetical protein HHA04nite_23470 [Halomonas halophila]|uniref:Uncharacterized protein n=1 Tax=Halomonas halophila TaxID=29573 RepID=A0ABQ0U5T1_9GAMM|nr:hypothetical protein HHA04nite_23470 [Halomonas halophila]